MTISTMYEAPFPVSFLFAAKRRASVQHTNNEALWQLASTKSIELALSVNRLSSATYGTSYYYDSDCSEQTSDDYDYQQRYTPSMSSISIDSELSRGLPSSANSLRRHAQDQAWRRQSTDARWWPRLQQLVLCSWCNRAGREEREEAVH